MSLSCRFITPTQHRLCIFKPWISSCRSSLAAVFQPAVEKPSRNGAAYPAASGALYRSIRTGSSRQTPLAAAAGLVRALYTTATQPGMEDLVDITNDNFQRVLPLVQNALENCQFYSFDCEMTGLKVHDSGEEYLDEIEDRYNRILQASQSFVINQFGLSCFTYDNGMYHARTFNFYVFPRPFESFNKRYLSEAASVAFLANHGFDFNKWIHKGVSFLPADLRDQKLQQVEAPREERREVVPKAQDDIAFVRDLIEQVTSWLAKDTSPMLDLPAVNAFRRLLQYQELEKSQFGISGHPGFYVQKLSSSDNSWPTLRLIRGSVEEVRALEAAQRQERIKAIGDAAGFTAVMDMMRACGRPAVGHNALFDVAYALSCFATSEMPTTWADFKRLADKWFPAGIYDTKHLSKQVEDLFESETSLGSCFRRLSTSEGAEPRLAAWLQAAGVDTSAGPALPDIKHAPGFEKYVQVEAGGLGHEAGYDAYMTGCVFAGLLPIFLARTTGALEVAPSFPQLLGAVAPLASRINLTRSDIPYASLRGEDPEPDRSHIFFLSELSPGFRYNELIRRFQAVGLGKVRISGLSATTALVEVDVELAPKVLAAFPEQSDFRIIAFAEYSAARRAAAAAAAATSSKKKRARVEREEPAVTPAPGPEGQEAEGGGNRLCAIM